MKTVAALVLVLIAAAAYGTSVGLFYDPALPAHGAPSSAEYLQKLLADAGYTVKRLSSADLMSETVLDRSNFDILVLPQGESYPAKGRDALFRYLKQGGDFISMGGYAFDRLCYQDSAGNWRPKEELFGKLGVQGEPVMLFDFEGSLDGWKPGSGTAEMPTAKSATGHAGGKSLEINIPNYQNYHGVTSDIGTTITPGSNFISFWARSDDTPEITVECDEKDGSRWIAVVKLTPQWKKHDVPASDFKHWYDSTNRRDVLHIDNAKTLTFGLAFTHTKRVLEGPHTFSIDDVQAVKGSITDPGDDRINTRFSDRETTGLVGVFDASCPLKWVSQAESNPNQLFLPNLKLKGNYAGYAAIGSFEEGASRWVPLIVGMDKFGRPRGSLGSMVIHYSGDRAGSVWAFFGVNNVDLFKSPEMGKALVQLVNAMTRGLYLNQTGSDLACYRVGEEAKISTTVSNFGTSEQKVTLWLHITVGDGDIIGGSSEELSLAPGESKQIMRTWKVPETAPDFCRINAILLQDGRPIDTEESAFTIWDENVLRSGPKLTYKNGRFKLDGAPRMLFGSNETATFWLGLAQNNPLGWDKEIRAMANDGLRVIRIHTSPMFFWPTENEPNEPQFRKLDAWIQLCRKHGIAPYVDLMDWAEGLKDPWLHHDDYMMDPASQRDQHKYVLAFASRYKDTLGVMYDEDNEVVDNTNPDAVHIKLWNEWLAAKYGSTEGLAKAWGKYLNGEKLGEVAYDPGEDVWDNRRSFDWRYFHRTNVRDRFVRNFADAVREGDPDAIASISGLNIGAMDQFTVTEPLDLADNHFYHALQLLPMIIKGSDLRPTGIGSAIGEYGCVTHPTGYDSEYYFPPGEQITRFLWVGHYVAGCGGSMALNWDFRDPLSGSFPWGIHYAGDLVEKDALIAQRQMIRFFNRIPMEGKLPGVLVCVPDNNRLGGRGGDVLGAVNRCMQILTDNHVDFTVIREWKLDKVPAGTKAILFPVPYCISDQTYGQLKAFVEAGGALYFSGDISFSPEREYLGDSRLTGLAGVRAATPPNPNDPWAARRIEPTSAKILSPGLATNQLGKGLVMYSADPFETAEYSKAALASGWQVYSRFLARAGIKANAVSPEGVHCFRQPLAGGGSAYVLINKGAARTIALTTQSGTLSMALGGRKPGVAAIDAKGNVRALEAQGAVTLNGKPLVDAQGHFLLMTLDGLDVRKSRQVMVLPIGPGKITIHSTWKQPVVELGQEEDGRWRSLARIEPVTSAAGVSFAWDDVQASGVFLLTERAQAAQAIKSALNPLKP